ncbi:hypothetical protein BH09MYX1_BH09MYX1_00030 [soil metagenome]
MTTYHFEIIAIEEGSRARCVELGVEAIGSTPDRAVTNLREALAAKLTGSEAVAPPETPAIEFELVKQVAPATEPFGPGDTRRAASVQ